MKNRRGAIFPGLVLIALGLWFLADALGWQLPSLGDLWPIFPLGFGLAALVNYFTEGRQNTPQVDYGLYPTQGQQLFVQALASGLPQLLISTLDFAQLRRHQRQPEQLPTLTASSKQDRPMLGIDYVAPRTPVESWLAGIWQTYLAIAPIGIADDYFLHLGQDSLNAMALINRIQDELGALVHLQMIFAGY